MPGYDDHTSFTSTGLFRRLRAAQYLPWKVADTILLLGFFIPAYAYRLSIKSTCWVYLPLIYIAHERDFAVSTVHLLDRLAGRKEWARRVLAVITFIGFIFTSLVFNLAETFPEVMGRKLVSPLEYFFLIDVYNLKPWQVCSLMSALITAYLFVEAGEIRTDHRHAGQKSVARRVERIKILMRCRNVFSAILIFILVLHALLVFSPIMTWLPAHILRILTWFYGSFMPPV